MKKEVRKETITKYFNALVKLKKEIEEGRLNSMREFQKELQLSCRTSKTLIDYNVIIKHGSTKYTYYTWNDKIPVTMLLAKKVLITNNKVKNSYLNNKPSTLVKKKGGARIGAGRPKAIVTKLVKKEVTNTKQVGLIRKFLRWIY